MRFWTLMKEERSSICIPAEDPLPKLCIWGIWFPSCSPSMLSIPLPKYVVQSMYQFLCFVFKFCLFFFFLVLGKFNFVTITNTRMAVHEAIKATPFCKQNKPTQTNLGCPGQFTLNSTSRWGPNTTSTWSPIVWGKFPWGLALSQLIATVRFWKIFGGSAAPSLKSWRPIQLSPVRNRSQMLT